jgi:hypothetical protein
VVEEALELLEWKVLTKNAEREMWLIGKEAYESGRPRVTIEAGKGWDMLTRRHLA